MERGFMFAISAWRFAWPFVLFGMVFGLEHLEILLLIVAIIAVYFLPAFIAHGRCHPNSVAIFMLNLFLGWSLLGWVAALVWSVISLTPRGEVLR